MKRIASTILIANIFVSLWAFKSKATTFSPPTGDTVVVKMKNKNKVIIITEKSKDLGSLKSIDINQIVADIDSTFRSDSSGSNGGDLEIRISSKDSVLTIKRRKQSGGTYKAVVEVHENGQVQTYGNDESGDGRKWGVNFGKRKHPRNDMFEIDLGWNNYLEDGKLPGDQNKSYGLLPYSSNIVNLRFNKTLLGRNEKSRFLATAGLEFSCNNLKFENDVIVTKGSDAVSFDPFPADQKKIKSKLTVSWLNLPLMAHYQAKKYDFHLGIGGFVGYRLGSHTKTKFETDNIEKKDKVYSNFFLQSVQYGVRAEIGFYSVDLFASYNLNELFVKGRGPALTPISFGITL
jgi:hypothetical protein